MNAPPAVVLIVDDSPEKRETLRLLLSAEPYRIVEASGGSEALHLARELQPDLILLDVMMPEIDGYEVCRRLRADPSLAEVPIIMVTALADKESRMAGLQAGADDIITRPYDREELRARIRTITRLNRYRKLQAQQEQLTWAVAQADDGYLLVDGTDLIVYANDRARHYLELPPGEGGLDTFRFRETAYRHYRLEPAAAWQQWPELADPLLLVRPETPHAPACWLQIEVVNSPCNSVDRLIRLRDISGKVLEKRLQWTFQMAVSHKLRTPLNGLLGCLLLLQDDLTLTPDQQELFTSLEMSAHRLDRDINRIINLTDLKTYTLESRCHLDELPGLVERLSADLLPHPATVAISDIPPGTTLSLPTVSLEIILTELFTNARKFHPAQRPQVTVAVAPAGTDMILLTVTDDGITLAPKQRERAWLPYFQGDKFNTGEVPGMGLGLSMVAALVLGAGGRCRLTNRDDRTGVAIHLTLPLA